MSSLLIIIQRTENDIPTWQSGLRLLDLRDLQQNVSEHVTDVPRDQDVATPCPHGTRPRHGGGPWPDTELLAVTRRIKWRNRMHSAHVAKCEEITMRVRADLHLASLEMRLLVFRELLEPGYGTLILCNILCSERKFHKTRNPLDDGRWAQIYLKLMHCRLSNSWMKRVSLLLTPTVSSYLTQQQHLTYHSQLFTHCMHQRCSAMLLG